ncbi:methyltransferase domain-containing protein [Cadophora sp. MPI-SDFR-AT-0126]|nr:methyltransferase domain-containing protein [Leotiomycetes sp. MPI-SDFR-AT-0126]
MDYDWIIDGAYVPQSVARLIIRQVLKARKAELNKKSLTDATDDKLSYVAKLRTLPIAIETKAANEQQYEVSTGIFEAFLGPRMKYSCALFSTENDSLEAAEMAMLQEYIVKGGIEDGMTILDLGCGWGSGTLFFAKELPASKEHIEALAEQMGLNNVEIITGDVADFVFKPEQFDRVVSVELFEHMKNYELLMAKVASALKPGGRLLLHIFSHRSTPYDFDEGWMSRYFFTGGTMPSADLLLYFQRDLQLQRQWWISGSNYSKTLEAWLSNFMSNRKQVWPHLVQTYGEKDATVWYNRWIFYFIGGSEFFGTEGGEENGVSHYLFEKPQSSRSNV